MQVKNLFHDKILISSCCACTLCVPQYRRVTAGGGADIEHAVTPQTPMSPTTARKAKVSTTPGQKASGTTTRTAGTPDYIAPEGGSPTLSEPFPPTDMSVKRIAVLLGMPHGKEVDYWALGCIIYELITGIAPFNGDNVQAIFSNILNHQIEWPISGMSPEAKDLISRLLELSPEKRLGTNGAAEVKAHPFFKDINWETLRLQPPPFLPILASEDDTSFFEGRSMLKPVTPSMPRKAGETTATAAPAASGTPGSPETDAVDEYLYVNFGNLAEKTLDVLRTSGSTSSSQPGSPLLSSSGPAPSASGSVFESSPLRTMTLAPKPPDSQVK